jgi:predicted amidohydrolase
VKVAAYQAPLLPAGSMDALGLIRERVAACEAAGVSVLCCPEGILGGLADYADDPLPFAIPADRLGAVLAPLASNTVTTIVGFTELAESGRFYNSAVVFERGAVAGLYRKLHPAINRSVYEPGTEAPVFRAAGLTFGIVICNDSNFPEPQRRMAAAGARAIFIPTNCGMPPAKGGPELVDEARALDVRTAVENDVWVIRADVTGRAGALVSYGTSGIVDASGAVVHTARPFKEELLVASVSERQHGRDA